MLYFFHVLMAFTLYHCAVHTFFLTCLCPFPGWYLSTGRLRQSSRDEGKKTFIFYFFEILPKISELYVGLDVCMSVIFEHEFECEHRHMFLYRRVCTLRFLHVFPPKMFFSGNLCFTCFSSVVKSHQKKKDGMENGKIFNIVHFGLICSRKKTCKFLTRCRFHHPYST